MGRPTIPEESKCKIDYDIFMSVLKENDMSIRRLGPLIGYSEKTIRRHLKLGYMTPWIIGDICKALHVYPTWVINSR